MLDRFHIRGVLVRCSLLLIVIGCSDERDSSSSSQPATNGFSSLCYVCHGSSDNPAPPRDASGHTETSFTGVGAHQSHVMESDISAAFGCEACHTVPTTAAHATEKPTKVVFGSLAKTGDLSPVWNGTSCGNTYCHGSSLSGGTLKTPTWITVDGTQAACGTCHGFPPESHLSFPGTWGNRCNECHSATIAGPDSQTITNKAKHINGVVDFDE